MKLASVYSSAKFKAAGRTITNKYNRVTDALDSVAMLTPDAKKAIEDKFNKEMKQLGNDPVAYLEKLDKAKPEVKKKAPAKKAAAKKAAPKKVKPGAGGTEVDTSDLQ